MGNEGPYNPSLNRGTNDLEGVLNPIDLTDIVLSQVESSDDEEE